jgi:hypothetical protein
MVKQFIFEGGGIYEIDSATPDHYILDKYFLLFILDIGHSTWDQILSTLNTNLVF